MEKTIKSIKSIKKSQFLLALLLFTAVVFGCSAFNSQSLPPTASAGLLATTQFVSNTPETGITAHPTASPSQAETSPSQAESTPAATAPDVVTGKIDVHFINVGKADSILIRAGAASMLIDAGTPGTADTVIQYLKAQGVKKLDCVIGTHSHNDHIGGMPAVLEAFPVGMFLMPDVPDTSAPYQDLIQALSLHNIKWAEPKVGAEYRLAQATFTILAPNGKDYKNLNNYSIVIRLVFGSTAFLFTGDALSVSEKEILKNGLPLSSTLLKVAHHGGGLACSLEFLKAVNPKFAVISVDSSKKGYPSDKILQRLASLGISVYRTDEAGTIVATSYGKMITLDKNPSKIVPRPTKPKKSK